MNSKSKEVKTKKNTKEERVTEQLSLCDGRKCESELDELFTSILRPTDSVRRGERREVQLATASGRLVLIRDNDGARWKFRSQPVQLAVCTT